MIKLIVIGHGAMAEGLVHAMELIVGSQEEVVAIRLDETDSIDELESRVEVAVVQNSSESGTLILVDLFGASPFNVSARVASRHPNVDVITGVNLPMLLETAMNRQNVTLSELVDMARQIGVGGVKVLSDLVKGNSVD